MHSTKSTPDGLILSTSTLLGLVLASHSTFFAHFTHLLRDLTLFRAAWHTFRLARHSTAHQLLPRRPLFSPVRGLVHSPSLLPCEQHINNTIGLALLHQPSARFSTSRRATPAPPKLIPCPPLDNFWTAEPVTWAVTLGYVQLSNIVYSASRAEQS